jgi:hypothetical protein
VSPIPRPLSFVAALRPSYWAFVREEADYLISARGPAARDYAAAEAEEALSPAWTAFMRRVRAAIVRRQRGDR